jgi:drug/metabolite transporter (DMT)-like permease
MSHHRVALLQIHLAVLLAGATGLFGKLVSVGPTVITCGRTLVGAVALGLVAVVLKVDLRLRDFRGSVILALSGVTLAVHWVTFFHSIQVSTVAIGLLAFSTFPLMVTFLEPLFFREKLHRSDVLTAVIVTVGLVLVTPSLDLSNRLTQGLLWGLLSAVACALSALLSRSSSRIYPAVAVGFYQQAITASCTLPFAVRWPRPISWHDLLFLVILGLVFTALLQVLVLRSLRHIRAQTASVMFGLEPVYGIILAAALLGEIPSARTLVGGVLIFGAVLWASLQQKERTTIAEKLASAA